MREHVLAVSIVVLTGLHAASVLAAGPVAEPVPAEEEDAPVELPVSGRPWIGDFDGMLERRVVRVIVPNSRSLYFHDKGVARGLTADLIRGFEDYLNRKHKPGTRKLVVAAIPTTRDQMLALLQEGRGDIIAANLTVTPERQKLVDFSDPTARNVSEIIVTGPGAPALASLDDLAGKEVHVRASEQKKYRELSAYYESLQALNERFHEQDKPKIELTLLPPALEDEDVLEMVNAGIVKITVVDQWKAQLWAQVLPKLTLHPELAVRTGADIAWAFRKGSPKLAAEINAFVTEYPKVMGSAETRLKRYAAKFKQIQAATETSEMRKFEQLIAYFKSYGEKYGFDYLMLAAQGYQESRLDQNAKSHVGAIGVMQLMPATGAEMKTGDIHQTENNIHAGTKYMRQLFDRYFKDVPFDEVNRTLFAFASYNAGPGRVAQLRKQAEAEGLNPNVWFGNVELIAAKRVGQETVMYVRNIYKYYVAYKLELAAEDKRRQVRDAVEQKVKGAE